VLERYTYTPYGAVTIHAPDWTSRSTSSYDNTRLYTGREYDVETSLYYNRRRYYEPPLGRFINRDPIGYSAGDANLYRYVSNRPLNALDPLGYAEAPPQQVPQMPAARIPGDWPDPAPGTIQFVPHDQEVLMPSRAPSAASARAIYDANNRLVGLSISEEINCLAYAIGQNSSVFPRSDLSRLGGVFKELMPALGYKCYSDVSASECEKKCEGCDEYLMLYIDILQNTTMTEAQSRAFYERIRRALAGRDLFAENRAYGVPVDFHALRGQPGGVYRWIPGRTPWLRRTPSGTPTGYEPHATLEGPWTVGAEGAHDFFPPERILQKACCCRNKRDAPRLVLPE